MGNLDLTRLFRQSLLVCCALLLLLAGSTLSAYALEAGDGFGLHLAAPQAPDPNPPSDLTATAATQTQINLSWADNSDDETGFRIERSPDGSTGWSLIATVDADVVAYSDTTLTCGITAYYRVQAYRASDGKTSAYSNVANDTTDPCPPPAAPTGLSATTISETQIDLSWTDNSSDETAFHIERSPNGSASWVEIATVGSNVTAYSHTSLNCGTTHFYRVRAYRDSDAQYSTYSNTGTATTDPCPPPDAPTGLSATAVSLTEIDLSWTDNSDDETGFRIERSPDGSTGWTGIYTTTADAIGYSDTGLNCGTTYHYRVAAYRDSDGQYSAWSNIDSATTDTCPVPNAPTGLAATAVSQTQIDLAWTDNSSDETGFPIERSLTGTSGWTGIYTTTANVTDYGDTGLDCDTTYYYRVRAYRDGDGQYSGWSSVVSDTTQACGPGPLVYDSHRVDDDDADESYGNGNGIVECGETIELYVDLLNEGGVLATIVRGTITSTSPYIQFLYNTDSTYPDIPAGGTATNLADYDFVIDPNTPDEEIIHFDLAAEAASGGPWDSSFDIVVYCNHPPYEPTGPVPADGAQGRDVDMDLSWTGGDPNGDEVLYDVFLEADKSPPTVQVCEDSTLQSCDPGTLAEGTEYFWQVVATDEHTATTSGPVWSFTTYSPCSDIIQNGGFEADSDWVLPVTDHPAAYSMVQKHSGLRSMRTGIVQIVNDKYSYSSARQTVTIPAGTASATLGLWLYRQTYESAALDAKPVMPPPKVASLDDVDLTGDVQYVLILNSAGQIVEYLYWDRQDVRQFTYHEFDLSHYAGWTISVHFGVYNDGDGNPTAMWVDDVSLDVCPLEPGNQAPDTPSQPVPGNGAQRQPINTQLYWVGGDPDGDAVTYNVYLQGDQNPPVFLTCEDLTSPTCAPPTLAYDTTYYWFVVATDEHGASTTGPTWQFHTVAGPDRHTWYLAEGFTGAGFGTFILLQNSTIHTATVDVTYMLEGGGTITRTHTVSPVSRYTILANDVGQVGLDQAFSTKLESDQPIIVERAMYWPNGEDMIGGHETVGIAEPSTQWYFAEGFTGAGFQTFLLLQNPNDVSITADVGYLLSDGTVVAKSHILPANSRYTILTNNAGEVGLDKAFSTVVVADLPIIAERAMYFANEGHVVDGVMQPAPSWYLAEGFTGVGMDTFVLVQNPNAASTTVEVAYLLQGGGTITTTHVVPANSRHTIWANDAAEAGTNKAFATVLIADRAIVVERAMYWPNGTGTAAGHATAGATAASTAWNLAEGYTGDGFETFILLLNPTASTATVEATYMLAGGGTVVRYHVIAPESRYTIATQSMGEVGLDQAFSTRLESDLPIVVERAMYFGGGGHAAAAVPD